MAAKEKSSLPLSRELPPTPERGISEASALTLITKLYQKGADINNVADGLAGCDSPEAMAFRRELLEHGVYINHIAEGLAGCDSPEAMALRRELLEERADIDSVALGLAGCDTPETLALRRELLKQRVSFIFVALGLAGCDSPQALAFRRELLEGGASVNDLAQDLAGCDSPQALAFRQELLDKGGSVIKVVWGLAGCDSPQALAFRRELLEGGADIDRVAYSLAGCASPEAMVFRRELLKRGADIDRVAAGLAGCASPEAMTLRQELLDQGANKNKVVAAITNFNTGSLIFTREYLARKGKLKVTSSLTPSIKVVDLPATPESAAASSQPEPPPLSTRDHLPKESETSISYLGVQLPKAEAEGGIYVPHKERFSEYVEDDLTLKMERDIATAWKLNQAMLIEGGTSLGKTTTVMKMCSELGYEVHYINLTGVTDPNDLMGRYVPNVNRKEGESEYIFADGPVTAGLRQQIGKIKVILLDEFNSAPPSVLIRLHEVLDKLATGGSVILTEDQSEVIPTSGDKTKIIALTNPPGKGYLEREPVDKAQLRRWNYLKLADHLPPESFSNFTNSLVGLEADNPPSNLTDTDYFLSSNQIIPKGELKNIPGFRQIWTKYQEFHQSMTKLLAKRQLARDQVQTFTFDDRSEPLRVANFITHFFNGDLTQTIHQALHYYYLNKLESPEDKAAALNLIQLVETTVTDIRWTPLSRAKIGRFKVYSFLS